MSSWWSVVGGQWSVITFLVLRCLDYHQGLSVFDGLGVCNQDARYSACYLGLDLVHHLHRLDDADRLARLDQITFRDKGRLGRCRGGIIRAYHRRDDNLLTVGQAYLIPVCRAVA